MSAESNGGGKLRKELKGDMDEESTNSGKEKKKGMFGALFGRKKDTRDGSKTSMSSLDSLVSSGTGAGRVSEDYSRSSSTTRVDGFAVGLVSPTTAAALQPQQQQRGVHTSNEAKRSVEPHTPERSQGQVSQPRQRDQQQQALYQ